MVRGSVTGDSHTVEGIFELGWGIRRALEWRYMDAAQSMFEWRDPSGSCDTMFELSEYKAPECYLVDQTKVAIFRYGRETHMLPIATSGVVNIYGSSSSWRVVPNGGTLVADEIRHLRLNYDNSCIVCNSLHGTSDYRMIHYGVTMLVDCMLSLYQLILFCRAPFIINVEDMNDSNASSFMNAILNFSPWIVKNSRGGLLKPEVTEFTKPIDPRLLDCISHYDSMILSYLGFPTTDIHKRAQQSVPETLMTQSIVDIRRREKLRCRQLACERWNKKFKGQLEVVSVIDEMGGYDGLGDGEAYDSVKSETQLQAKSFSFR